LLVFAPGVHGQDGGIPQAYSKTPVFRIPFSSDGNERRWRQVQLYVSTEQGRNWRLQATAPPTDGGFNFTADRDGVYWFATQTVDLDGRAFPQAMDQAAPQLKVTVDTQPPFIMLRGLPPQDGMARFEWDLRDDNLDLGSLAVDYRVQGSDEWRPLRLDPLASGRHAWRPNTNAPMEVRLRVRDLAKNENEQKANVLPPDGESRFAADTRVNSNPDGQRSNNHVPPATPRGNVPYRFVNSTHIELNYKLKDVGRSGVSVVQLWYTLDSSRERRSWTNHSEKRFEQQKPPENSVYECDVKDEGIYGFSLVIMSGVGFGEKAPAVNDAPQLWVEVDLTKPVVKLTDVTVGRGQESGKLFINWQASDKNLEARPITLSYAEQAAGPWTPIQSEQENKGRFTWQMPDELPFQFFVKVEAADKAGNVGSDQTPSPVKVDLFIPKTEVLDVAPPKRRVE
jgi:hypothetical protein